MARPRKQPSERRGRVFNIRFTDQELEQLRQMARDAGLTYGRYARETLLGRRPRARPAQELIFNKLVYELHSIAGNFKQLATATGDDFYLAWAKFVGGQMVEHLIGADDLSDIIENQLDAINAAGHQVNILARKANSDQQFKPAERIAAFRAVTAALSPLREALQTNSKKKIPEPPGEG